MAAQRNSEEAFQQTWESPNRGWGVLDVVNNQPLGRRFVITAFIFFLLGGLLALLMRLQLARPENDVMGPEVYNQLFTMHGSSMMYLFAVPFLEGLAMFLVPLMIGSRDMAFPRLSAFGYWCYLFGGILFYTTFVSGMVPDMGWFAYTPLSSSRYADAGVDYWLLALGLVEIAGITAGIEIVVTILKLRAPGMGLQRMPLFVWTMLVTGIMIIFAFTTLLTATFMLELDRSLGTRFFDPQGGGSSLLWQHLFWFFGHPEVYIMFLPATGIVSMIVPAFARRPLAAYTLVVSAVMLTGFVSFGLWVHHMFASGLPELSMLFFTAASLTIAIASGVQVFAWIATLWGRRPRFDTPFLYILGFFFIFILGGITGVMVAVLPFDLQVHDTFFVVAHFHYVIIGGVVFPILAGLHFWMPKLNGRVLDERLGKLSFWLTFIGFNVTFFPMHILGFYGMPRRVYTYPAGMGLDEGNLIATVGAYIMALGILAFLGNFASSFRRSPGTDMNPYNGNSLEWTLPSPPPIYAFRSPPAVASRHPAWNEQRTEDDATRKVRTAMTAAPTHWRATVVTDVLTGKPQGIQYLSGPTRLPFMAAVGVLIIFLGVLAKVYLLSVAGLLVGGYAILRWLWPTQKRLERMAYSGIEEAAGVPVFLQGSHAPVWWGMVAALATVGMVYGVFLFSYFYLRIHADAWPQGGLAKPGLLTPGIAYLALLSIAPLQWLGARLFGKGRHNTAEAAVVGAMAAAAAFLVMQVFFLQALDFGPDLNAYASLFHVLSGMVMLTASVVVLQQAILLRTLRAKHTVLEKQLPLQWQLARLFAYFTTVAAAVVYAVIHVSPYLF